MYRRNKKREVPEGGVIHSKYAKGVIQEGSFHKGKKTLEGRIRSMKKGKILLFLVLVIVALFASNCVKQPPLAVPAAPAGLRVVQLAGGDVELRWDAVAGADSYDLEIQPVLGSESRETPTWPFQQNVTNTYYVAKKSILGAGKFGWNVKARNAKGPSDPTHGDPFIFEDPEPEPPVYGLLLTLEEEPDQGSATPTIYTIGSQPLVGERLPGISALNYLKGNLKREEIPAEADRAELAVQLLVQKAGATVAKRWPDDSTEFVLDEGGELNFNLCNLGAGFSPDLAPGNYYLWARAVWDGSESQKVPFEIASRNSDLNYEITVKDFEDRVCSFSSTNVTLQFDLSISGGEKFKELLYFIQIGPTGSTNQGSVTHSATFTKEATWTKKVLFEAECTKYATLTVVGTVTAYSCNGATVTKEDRRVEILNNVGINFVLDMKDPTALVSVLGPTEEGTVTGKAATLTFLASDTKCLNLDSLRFTVKVEKGIGDWTGALNYPDVETVLGVGSTWSNELTINAAYYATTTSAGSEATAKLTYVIGDLDLATITTTMNASDCCCPDCTLVDPCAGCNGGGDLTHATSVKTSMLVDNVFFSNMLATDDVLKVDNKSLGKVNGCYLIPASPAVATVTVKLADANWEPPNPLVLHYNFPGPQTISVTRASTAATLAVCSGYATKTQATYIATFTGYAEDNGGPVATETNITYTGTATDNAGNEFLLSECFRLDTMPPTLTHFAAFRNPSVTNGSYIEFSFHEEPVSAALTLEITGQGTFTYTLAQATSVPPHLYTYSLLTGISLSEGATVTLTAKAKDLAGNEGTSSWETKVSPSAPR
jgi:hypothetical protein